MDVFKISEPSFKEVNLEEDKQVVAWWSGGITSAIACKLALQISPEDALIE